MVVLCLLWGLQQVAIKSCAPLMSPTLQVSLRSLLAGFLVAGMMLWRRESLSLRDGTFRPGNLVTRGQLAKIVSNAAGFTEPATTQQFEDVPVGSTFHEFIWRLTVRGYVTGYPCGGPGEPCGAGSLPYFRPNANVTRGQMSKIVSEAAGYSDTPSGQQFQDVAENSTFYVWIWRLANRTIMSGYDCGGAGEPCVGPGNLPYFRPGNTASRGQASKVVSNTFFPACEPTR